MLRGIHPHEGRVDEGGPDLGPELGDLLQVVRRLLEDLRKGPTGLAGPGHGRKDLGKPRRMPAQSVRQALTGVDRLPHLPQDRREPLVSGLVGRDPQGSLQGGSGSQEGREAPGPAGDGGLPSESAPGPVRGRRERFHIHDVQIAPPELVQHVLA